MRFHDVLRFHPLRASSWLAAAASLLASCSSGGDGGTDTATVTFTNHSSTNRIYDVILDGAHVQTLLPVQSSTHSVAPDVTHSVYFVFNQTDDTACSTATFTLGAGKSTGFVCSH